MPEYDDLCYNIKRGRTEEVKEYFRKKKDFNPKLAMKPNGDTILHVCAEFDKTDIFEWAMNHWRHKKIFADEARESFPAGIDTPDDLQRTIDYLEK